MIRNVAARDHHGAIGVGDADFPVGDVVDQAQGRGDVEPRHLRAEESADDLRGREIDRRRDPFAGFGVDMVVERDRAHPVDPVGIDGVRHGLARFGVERPGVFVELIAAGDDFVAAREVFGRALQEALGIVGIGEFGLEEFPLGLDLGGFAIRPVLGARILGIGIDEVPQCHLSGIVRGRLDCLHPGGLAELLRREGRRRRGHDDGLHERRRRGHGRVVDKRRRRDVHRRTVDQIPGPIGDQPVVLNRRRCPVVAGTEMLPAEIDRRVGELMAVGRGNRCGRVGYGRVGGPIAGGIPGGGVADEDLGVRRVGAVLRNLGNPVVVVVVRVGDVGAVDVIQFDFEPMRLDPGVVDAIEIVEGSVGGARPDRRGQAECQQARCGGNESREQAADPCPHATSLGHWNAMSRRGSGRVGGWRWHLDGYVGKGFHGNVSQ